MNETVHIVEFGRPPCELFHEMPKELPEGHSFISAAMAIHNSSLRKMINCIQCCSRANQLYLEAVQSELAKRRA